jgi:hypothetical protein
LGESAITPLGPEGGTVAPCGRCADTAPLIANTSASPINRFI